MAFYLSKLSVNFFNTYKSAPKLHIRSVTGLRTKSILNNQLRFLNQAVEKASSMEPRKLPKYKTRKSEIQENKPGLFNIVALSTAREYDLRSLDEGLRNQKLYEVNWVDSTVNVLHAVAKYKVETEPREIFFFKEGSLVFWNVQMAESNNVLQFLKQYEQDSYAEGLVVNETELMNYSHQKEGKRKALELDSNFNVSIKPEQNLLEKYTFSNAIALSVKLGIWEAYLDKFINSIKHLADELYFGKKIAMSNAEILQKQGELLKIKVLINFETDLLNMPDFYWDREQLEPLYLDMAAYFSLDERTQVINQKLNECNDLVELLSVQLTNNHSIKLTWMIIILIAISVVFGFFNLIDRHDDSEVLEIKPIKVKRNTYN